MELLLVYISVDSLVLTSQYCFTVLTSLLTSRSSFKHRGCTGSSMSAVRRIERFSSQVLEDPIS